MSDVPELIEQLTDGRGSVRATALNALAKLGHPGPELAVFLRDGDPQVARAASEALKELGLAQRGNVVAIVNALDGARRDVVEIVEQMLSKLVGPADRELLEALDSSEASVCDAIVRACELVGVRGLELLLKAARDERTRVRINAMRGLARIGELDHAASMAALFGAAGEDKVSDVRSAAATAFATLTQRIKASELARRKSSDPVPAVVPELELREMTASELTSAAKIAPVDEMLRALGAARLHSRINALRILALQGPASTATARMVAALLRDEEAAVRAETARALGKLGAAAVAPALIKTVGDVDPVVSAAAEQALAEAGAAVADELVEGLDTADETHGARIAALLGRLGDGPHRLATALATTLIDVRFNAALGLAALGPARAGFAVSALAAVSASSNARVRSAVKRALAVLDPRPPQTPPPIAVAGFEERVLASEALVAAKAVLESVGALGVARHLADARPVVRANAAVALGVVGGEVSTLAAALRDDAPEVRQAAARGLELLGDLAVATVAPVLVRSLVDAALRDQVAAILGARALPAIDDALVRGLDSDELAAPVLAHVLTRTNAVEILLDAFARETSRANAARGMLQLPKAKRSRVRTVLTTARTSISASERHIALATLHALDGAPAAPTVPEVAGFETTLLEPAAFTGKLDPAQLLPFLTDARAIVRANAATALGAVGPAAAPYALTLAASLRDDDTRVRTAAARAIGKLGDDAVIAAAPSLVAALRGDEGVAAACKAVLASQQGAVERALLAGLETDDETHGIRVAELVCKLPEARDLLFAAFDGEAQNVQINAAFGIALLGESVAGAAGRRRLVGGLAGPFTRRRSAMEKGLGMLARSK